MTTKEEKFDKPKDHLNKTFLEELGMKIWSTKGARFRANQRLLVKAELSNRSIGFLSAYLIIFGLLSVYQTSSAPFMDLNLLAFGSTALSILLLAFSQMESAQDYKMKAYFFHKCSLELAPIHNKVRIFKTLLNTSQEEKTKFCREISDEYQKILNQYPNHDDIDFKTFQIKHRKEQYTNLVWIDVLWIETYYYLRTKLIYHMLILLPPVIIVGIVLMSN